MIQFEWDQPKAKANLRKHGVSFEEAQSVFYDEFAVQFYDDEHSKEEERFLLLGMSDTARLLLVCHCSVKQAISFESFLHAKPPSVRALSTGVINHES